MKAKNLFKGLTVLGASIGTVAAVNKVIFKIAKSTDTNFTVGEYYPWQYGNVHYVKKGIGSPILLLHSLAIGSSHREFEKNIDEISKNHTVYAVDLPGFGYSNKPKITYTAFTYAAFINSFIADVIQQPCAAVAANGSGMFLAIAAKLFPANITKLMLISPSGINSDMAEDKDFYKRTLKELPLKGTAVYNYFASKRKIKEFLCTDGFFAPHYVDDEVIDAFYHSAHGTNGDARYAYASCSTKYMNMDIKEYFKNLTQPICVIWGEKNTVNPVENMDILKRLNESANFYIFEETKLFPHIENYEEFNDVINENL